MIEAFREMDAETRRVELNWYRHYQG